MNVTHDMQLEHFQNTKIIKSNGTIFLLNGIELFALNVADKSDGKVNLKKIGSLGGVDNQIVSDIKV